MNATMSELRERMFLEQYLKNAVKQNQHTYATYLKKRLSGEVLTFESISREELGSLITQENIATKQIAFLFDTDKDMVKAKRTQWGIKKELNLVS
jgi:hypothetical protein